MSQIFPASFTIRGDKLLFELETLCEVAEAFRFNDGPIRSFSKFKAIWDTGATCSVISQKVVDTLGLKPTGIARFLTAAGEQTTETYLVNLILPNQIRYECVRVCVAEISCTDVLIGMDIITAGDFAVTNQGGKTTFSFRHPSMERFDFVDADDNAPCPCASGRLFKDCHKTAQILVEKKEGTEPFFDAKDDEL